MASVRAVPASGGPSNPKPPVGIEQVVALLYEMFCLQGPGTLQMLGTVLLFL
jgi:hypothetical protein